MFFFDYRYIWESIVVWKIGCFTKFIAYPITKTMFHSQDQTKQLNRKPDYEYTTGKLVLSSFRYKKKKHFSLHFTLHHFSFVSFSPEKKKNTRTHFSFLHSREDLVSGRSRSRRVTQPSQFIYRNMNLGFICLTRYEVVWCLCFVESLQFL
jgi:hypothetical protein